MRQPNELKMATWKVNKDQKIKSDDEAIFEMFFEGKFELIICPYCGSENELKNPDIDEIPCTKCNRNFLSPLSTI